MGSISTDFEDAIYDFVVSATGIGAIWLYPDAARPPLPYLSLNISSGPSKVGEITERRVSEDVYKYIQTWRMTLTVNSYALDQHMALLGKIVTSTSLPGKISILRAAGLAVWGPQPGAIDITELLNTMHEPRGAVDLFLSYGEETTDDTVGEIHTVDSDYDLSGRTGTIVTTID